jgi:hypothetical protein
MPMVSLMDLWMPIVLSAVIVFVASSLIHMVLGYHKSDYRPLPNEPAVLDALRAAGVTPGAAYHFPYCPSHKEMKNPEHIEKLKKGPIGLMTIIPNGEPNMGKYLGAWFAYLVVVNVFIAYVCSRTLAPNTIYLEVFRVAGTLGFMAYGLGMVHESIWAGRSWGVTIKHLFDALIYGCLTAGVFGWRWPKM